MVPHDLPQFNFDQKIYPIQLSITVSSQAHPQQTQSALSKREIIVITQVRETSVIDVFFNNQATDSDEGNNSRIAYELLNTKDSTGFSIDRETGWIKAKVSYAGQFGKEFSVDVIAKDRFGDEPYLNDTAEVKVG